MRIANGTTEPDFSLVRLIRNDSIVHCEPEQMIGTGHDTPSD